MAGSRPGPARVPRVGESSTIPGSTSIHLAVERTPVMRLARTMDNRAWLPGAYGAVYRANLRIAREVQDRAVRNLKQSIVRPAQRTGTLERAIASPQAVYADAQRIIVGVGDYLDAVASYWRPVESGAPGLQGMVAYGFWTRAPRSNRGKVSLEAPMRGTNTGRPIILSWDVPPARRAFMWTLENIPDGKFFFLNAWQEVGRSGFMEDAYRDEFRQAVGPNGRPIQLGRLFRAYHGRPLVGSDFEL